MWCVVITALVWLAVQALRAASSHELTETSPLASVAPDAPVFPNAEVFDQDAHAPKRASWSHGEAGQ